MALYRKRERLKKLGWSVEEYDQAMESQSSLCAICGLPEKQRFKGGEFKRLAADHDHATGRRRALLCGRCNSGLGYFRDNADALEAAAQYIRKHSQEAS